MTLVTMTDLQSYLSATTYDITIILLTDLKQDPYIKRDLCAQYSLLQKDKTYTLTYEYLIITSVEILQFYSINVTSTLPYLVTYKKRYNRDPWWYPCKQAEAGSTDNLNVFILYSLKN
jgi:hypothetical protein